MRIEKSVTHVQTGPGGRYCICCAPPPTELKKQETRKGRRSEYKMIKWEVEQYVD